MHKIGIDERTHALICDYVDGTLDEKKRTIIERLASKSKSIRSMIDDSRYSRKVLRQFSKQLQTASLK